MQRIRKAPRIFITTMMAIAASVVIVSISGSASAADPTYAKVTGHAAFSNEANNPSFWGDNCTKIDEPGGDSYVLPAGTYTKVIVKAGSGEFANTIFAEPPKAGETVWADTNGDGVYNPGGKDGDKSISHIILCEGTPPPPPTKEKVSGSVTFEEGSVQCMRDVVLYQPPTYDVGGSVHVVYDTTRGHHEANYGQTVTVNATGVDDPSKYELAGQTTFTHTFAAQPAPPADCGQTKPPKKPHHPKPKHHHNVTPVKTHCNAGQTLVNGECVNSAVAHTGLSDHRTPVWEYALASLMALLLVPASGLVLKRIRIRR